MESPILQACGGVSEAYEAQFALAHGRRKPALENAEMRSEGRFYVLESNAQHGVQFHGRTPGAGLCRFRAHAATYLIQNKNGGFCSGRRGRQTAESGGQNARL